MSDLISRKALLAEYDRQHEGEPGRARKLIEEAPVVDAVVLPCKLGDVVWAIRSYKGIKRPQKNVVSEMFFRKNMELIIVVSHVARGLWGETVFATKEDAEKALGERKENETN